MSDPYRLIQSIRDNNIDFTRLLLQSDYDPNFQDVDGNTGLIISSMNDYYDIDKLLLDYYADPNKTNLFYNITRLDKGNYDRQSCKRWTTNIQCEPKR